MANLPTKLQISKGDMFQVDPRELVLEHENVYTGRWKPVSDAVVLERAESFLEHKQLEPCRVRLLKNTGPKGVYALVSGFTRARASLLITADPDLRARAGLEEGAAFPLKVIRSTSNEETAIVETIVENAQRKETTPIDDAHNHERMRNLGYKDTDIARITGLAQQTVSKYKRLLSLEERFQDAIHTGELTVENGLGLLDIDPTKRDDVISPASIMLPDMSLTEDGIEEVEITQVPEKSTTERVKEARRNAGTVVRLSAKEVRSILAAYTAPDVNHGTNDSIVKHILEQFRQLIDGEIKEGVFLDSITAVIDN